MAQTIRKTDSQLQQDVLRELKWDTRVDETEVGVQVKDGVVALTGVVSSWAKKIAAQEAAHRVMGVLDVANDLEVQGLSTRTDADIARAVRIALEWDVFVPHQRIRTTVSQGVVTLEGSADYWSQRDDAQRAIKNLEGVRGIINRIEVKPPIVPTDRMRQSIEAALERHAEREARRVSLDVENGRVTVSGVVGSYGEREAVVGAVRGTPGVRAVDDKLRIEPFSI
jgi:osmotically-inducible protein OsmY